MINLSAEHHAVLAESTQSQAFDASQGWVGIGAVGVGIALSLVALFRHLRATLLNKRRAGSTAGAVVARRFAQR